MTYSDLEIIKFQNWVMFVADSNPAKEKNVM
jgi:hypothetical protein